MSLVNTLLFPFSIVAVGKVGGSRGQRVQFVCILVESVHSWKELRYHNNNNREAESD